VLHGVTTVIGGNCGFALAPLEPRNVEYIKSMMSRVEAIPISALEEGVTWDWEGFAEMIGRYEGTLGPNAGFLAGHSTIRRSVLGEDATRREATEDEVARMCAVLTRCLSEGALGFSTSLHPAHSDAFGDPVPSRFASRSELLALAGCVKPSAATTVQLVPEQPARFSSDEVELLIDLSLTSDRPVNWNLLKVTSADPEGPEIQMSASTRALDRGARVHPLVLTQSIRPYFSFLNGFVIDALPGWASVLRLPIAERIAALADRDTVQMLRAGAAKVAGRPEMATIGIIAEWERVEIVETFSAANAGFAGRTVGDLARERRADPLDVLLDVVRADELRTVLTPPALEDDDESCRRRAEVWKDPRVVVGGSDAGAHVEMMCGATYTTKMLGQGVRTAGLIGLEEAVHQLTEIPARLYGLKDRGRVAPGWWADLVVFDPDTVGPEEVQVRHDFPGAAAHLSAGSKGVERVFVNGVEVAEAGEYTSDRPGKVLRSGPDTERVSVSGS
jgi:N-acyl-D-aspartate/D-glutamate deacylase